MSYVAKDTQGAQVAWALVLGLGAFMCGVLATLVWGCVKLVGIRRELHENWEWKRKSKDDVQVIEESPPPTRSARLMSSESHRRMAQSFRARRRGGRRRFGEHRRHSTLIYNPSIENDCGYACILKAKGLRLSKESVQEIRKYTADAVYEAYVNDSYVGGMSVRGHGGGHPPHTCSLPSQSALELVGFSH